MKTFTKTMLGVVAVTALTASLSAAGPRGGGSGKPPHGNGPRTGQPPTGGNGGSRPSGPPPDGGGKATPRPGHDGAPPSGMPGPRTGPTGN